MPFSGPEIRVPVGERADLLNISLDLPQLLDGPLIGFLGHLCSLLDPWGLVVPSEGFVSPLAIHVVARPRNVYVEPFRVTWSMLLDQGLNSVVNVPQSLAPQHRHLDSRASVLILECCLKFVPGRNASWSPGSHSSPPGPTNCRPQQWRKISPSAAAGFAAARG